MKKLIILLLCLSLMFVGCKKSETTYSDDLSGTRWSVVKGTPSVTHTFLFRTDHNCTYII